MKNIPTYFLDVDAVDNETGVSIISIVDRPAVKVLAVKLSAMQAVKLKVSDEARQELVGPVLIPDMPIYRRDDDGTEYNIQYTAAAVERIRYKFFEKTGNLKLSNQNHDAGATVPIQLTDSWIVKDPKMDTAVAYGLDLPAGTWVAKMHIQDADVWKNEIQTGKLNGFSIEGAFMESTVQLSESLATVASAEAPAEDEVETLLGWLLSTVKGDEDHV